MKWNMDMTWNQNKILTFKSKDDIRADIVMKSSVTKKKKTSISAT
jgi:hypothetical protein